MPCHRCCIRRRSSRRFEISAPTGGQIALLSIGLVVMTTLAGALVAHEMIDGLGWAPAFALGDRRAVDILTDPLVGDRAG